MRVWAWWTYSDGYIVEMRIPDDAKTTEDRPDVVIKSHAFFLCDKAIPVAFWHLVESKWQIDHAKRELCCLGHGNGTRRDRLTLRLGEPVSVPYAPNMENADGLAGINYRYTMQVAISNLIFYNYINFNVSIPDGVWKKWHPNGRLHTETYYRNNMKHGKHISYDETTGDKVLETIYYNDVQHGTDSRYSGGRLIEKTEYCNGLKHGLREEYKIDDTGFTWLHTEGRYCNDVKQDKWIVFRHDGKPESETNWFNGRKHGRCQTWWPNGKPRYDGMFFNGKRDGLMTLWDEDGRFATLSESYVNDVQHGEFTNRSARSDNDGILVQTTMWVYGKRHGPTQKRIRRETDIHVSMTDVLTGTYENGLKTGVWCTYSAQNGSLLAKEHWCKDQLHGSYEQYAEGAFRVSGCAMPIQSGDYWCGQKEGQWEWTADEMIVETREYHSNGQASVFQYYSTTDPSKKRKAKGVVDKTGKYIGVWQQWREDGTMWNNGDYVHENTEEEVVIEKVDESDDNDKAKSNNSDVVDNDTEPKNSDADVDPVTKPSKPQTGRGSIVCELWRRKMDGEWLIWDGDDEFRHVDVYHNGEFVTTQ